MADIGIAVAISVLTLFTAYLGVHLTMHPVETNTERWFYKIGFLVCGVAICTFIGVQTYRNERTQRSLIDEMKRIEANQITETQPYMNISPPSPVNAPYRSPLKNNVPAISQKSSGPCSPNIVGNGNTNDCAPQPTLTATSQLRQKMQNGEWLTSFTVSANILMQTGDLKLLCDGPVLRAGISRINPAEFISGSNGPSPSNPNEVIYQLGPEMLSPGTVVTIGVYSANPVRVIAGRLGHQEIIIPR